MYQFIPLHSCDYLKTISIITWRMTKATAEMKSDTDTIRIYIIANYIAIEFNSLELSYNFAGIII